MDLGASKTVNFLDKYGYLELWSILSLVMMAISPMYGYVTLLGLVIAIHCG